MEHVTTSTNSLSTRISRISWGAVLAGALTSITVLILLNLLGLGIGLTAIDPMTDAQPLEGVGIGTIIYWVLSSLAALFVGGMVAGRTSGLPASTDGGLHGFLAWGIHLLLGIFFVTSFVGSILGGIGDLAASVFGGNDVKEVMVNVDKARDQATNNSTFSIEEVKQEIISVIKSAEK